MKHWGTPSSLIFSTDSKKLAKISNFELFFKQLTLWDKIASYSLNIIIFTHVHLNIKKLKKLTYKASSLVGVRIRALVPMILECFSNWLTSGMMKAAVFPLPVREQATTSLPSKMCGIALRCIGVGTLYPFTIMALKTAGFRFIC